MGINRTSLMCAVLALALLVPALALAEERPVSGVAAAVSAATAIVRPSVVAVETRFDKPRTDDEFQYWQMFVGARPLRGLWGSGFIYKDPHYVITSNFLTKHAVFIRVILDDGRSFKAEKVGENKDFQLAVLKVDWGPDLEPVAPVFGDSDKLMLGQRLALVGKSMNTVDTFATMGTVSALRKQVTGSPEPTDQLLQFDASFELTYTGAPLVDVQGQVIGMVTNSAGVGLNLGVPINELAASADKIISGENAETWFGVETQLMTTGLKEAGYAPAKFDWNNDGKAEAVDFGMWVSYVEPNSPADVAGLKAGDTIVELDGKFIKYQYDWYSIRRNLAVGQLITVKFIRKNEATGKWERSETQVQILAAPPKDEDENGNPVLPPGHPKV
jgi:S1-C subfamily serine protease